MAYPHQVPAQLGDLDRQILAGLYQHRLLSTAQIHCLHNPDASRRWVQLRLARLEQRGYLARVAGPRPTRPSRWFVSDQGAKAVEAAGLVRPRTYRMSADRAAAATHLLDVNEVGVALTRAARARGDEFDWRCWHNEVAHRYGSHSSEVAIADAVLHYTTTEPDDETVVIWRIIEVDRGTETTHQLLGKLRNYAAAYHYTGPRRGRPSHPRHGWRSDYPAFPGVAFVLVDSPRYRARSRIERLLGLYQADPVLTQASWLQATVTTLAELNDPGPAETIFTRLDNLEQVDLFGRPPAPPAEHSRRDAQPPGPPPRRESAAPPPLADLLAVGDRD